MYDQSFNEVSISRMLRKSDFLKSPRLKSENIKSEIISNSVNRSSEGFSGLSFLASTKVKRKLIYRISEFSDELVLRKIDKNIRKSIALPTASRDSIIANIKSLLSEAVSYKVYRLDVKGYYESFDASQTASVVSETQRLSPLTKQMVNEILSHHLNTGGVGLPRGLALSATLSEIMMLPFDSAIRSTPEVFFYSRYVDDIIIITSGNEIESELINLIKNSLPSGLKLNNQKTDVKAAIRSVQPYRPPALTSKVLSFEFLGYQFTVWEPQKVAEDRTPFRKVQLDIADSKVRKIKTRLTRAAIDYCKTLDFNTLEARIRFLTSNFSVLDADRERKRLAGIYYNYHRADADTSIALKELDSYLKKIALSGRGKVFSEFLRKTTPDQRRRLLSFSFSRGFREKIFMHFPRETLKRIQECWVYV